ncbi:MAG: AMIN domain-containing protein [Deltaproteobacteria bacterium]|nr:AMIN domain-containing protein [Deltaproteobacteria bacterium]
MIRVAVLSLMLVLSLGARAAKPPAAKVPPPKAAAKAAPPKAPAVALKGHVVGLRVGGDEGHAIIQVQSDRPLSFTTLRLSGPPRLVLDFADAGVKGVPAEQDIEDGTVRRVGAAAAGSRTARVVIELAGEAEFDVRSQGTRLDVRVPRLQPMLAQAGHPSPKAPASPQDPIAQPPPAPADPAPQPTPAATDPSPEPTPQAIARVDPQPAPAGPQPQTQQVEHAEAQPVEAAAAPHPAPVQTAPPAQAARLEVAREPAAAGLAASLPKSSETSVATPLAKSSDTSQKSSETSPSKSSDTSQKSSETSPATSPPPAAAAPSFAAQDQALPPPARSGHAPPREPAVTQLAAAPPQLAPAPPQPAPTPGQAAPTPVQPPPPESPEAAPSEPPAAVAELSEDEKAASLPTVSLAPAQRRVATASPPPPARAPRGSAHAPAPSTSRRVAQAAGSTTSAITRIGFRPIGGGEVLVHSDRELAVRVTTEPSAIVLHLRGAANPVANNRRPLDTHFFGGPVLRVVPEAEAGGTQVRIELRGNADYQLSQTAELITVTFAP